MQRFKLGLHGADLEVAAIIGYLQDGTADHWHRIINGWITKLARAKKTPHDRWTRRDRLQDVDRGHGYPVSCRHLPVRTRTLQRGEEREDRPAPSLGRTLASGRPQKAYSGRIPNLACAGALGRPSAAGMA